MSIHPLLSWTELDIWGYIRREEIPVCPLYLSRTESFRSLGCVPCTSDRSGAATVDEISRSSGDEPPKRRRPGSRGRYDGKLRSLGYM